jgi:hypothetical protein
MPAKNLFYRKTSFFYQRILLFTLFFAYVNSFVFSQNMLNTSPVGKWREGTSNAVKQVGNTVFYTNGCFLEIAEVNENNEIQKIASFESRGHIQDFLIEGDMIYLAIYKLGVSIISIEDLLYPKLLGYVDLVEYYPRLFKKHGFLYCYSLYRNQIKQIDISDPASPEIIRSFFFQSANNVSFYGEYMFAACGWEGLKVYDFSASEAFVEVYTDKSAYCYDVDIENDIACVVMSDTIRILDISSVDAPLVIGKIANSVYHFKASINGDMVYAAGYSLSSYDISDPMEPSLVDNKYLPNIANSIFVTGDYILVATDDKLIRFKADEAGILTMIGEIVTPGLSNSIALYGNYAYVSNLWGSINILDISDPESPFFINTIPITREVMSVKIVDNFLIVSNWGIRIFDISDPLNPVEISYLGLNTQTYKFYIIDDIVYLAAGSKGLAIIDASDLNQLELISLYDTPGIAFDLDVHSDENLIYVADWNGGMRIIDISDPAAPIETGSIEIFSFESLRTVKVSGQYVWIGSSNYGIRIYDISDLSNPVWLRGLNNSRGYEIQIWDNLAVVSSGYDGIYVYDITRFEDPQFIGRYITPGDVRALVLNDKLMYCADYYCGVTVFEFDQCKLLEIENEKQNISCYGDCDGSIQITGVQFSESPLQYEWSNGQSSAFIGDLCEGEYSVTITDGNNCEVIDSFVIDEPAELVFSNIEKTNITNTSSHGAISTTISGGTTPYSYQWTGPGGFSSTNKDISMLAEGCYRLTVTDKNACILVSDEICIADETTSIDNLTQKPGFTVYPNPANDLIYFRFSDVSIRDANIERIDILTETGVAVKSWRNFYADSVNIEDLPGGMYIVKITIGNKSMHSGLVVH